MSGCNHDCSNCTSKCEKADFKTKFEFTFI